MLQSDSYPFLNQLANATLSIIAAEHLIGGSELDNSEAEMADLIPEKAVEAVQASDEALSNRQDDFDRSEMSTLKSKVHPNKILHEPVNVDETQDTP